MNSSASSSKKYHITFLVLHLWYLSLSLSFVAILFPQSLAVTCPRTRSQASAPTPYSSEDQFCLSFCMFAAQDSHWGFHPTPTFLKVAQRNGIVDVQRLRSVMSSVWRMYIFRTALIFSFTFQISSFRWFFQILEMRSRFMFHNSWETHARIYFDRYTAISAIKSKTLWCLGCRNKTKIVFKSLIATVVIIS